MLWKWGAAEIDVPCECIVGFSEGCDEAWLVYEDDPSRFIEYGEDVYFKYCPMCGVKLYADP